jgi:hypothetical protein
MSDDALIRRIIMAQQGGALFGYDGGALIGGANPRARPAAPAKKYGKRLPLPPKLRKSRSLTVQKRLPVRRVPSYSLGMRVPPSERVPGRLYHCTEYELGRRAKAEAKAEKEYKALVRAARSHRTAARSKAASRSAPVSESASSFVRSLGKRSTTTKKAEVKALAPAIAQQLDEAVADGSISPQKAAVIEQAAAEGKMSVANAEELASGAVNDNPDILDFFALKAENEVSQPSGSSLIGGMRRLYGAAPIGGAKGPYYDTLMRIAQAKGITYGQAMKYAARNGGWRRFVCGGSIR